MFARALIVLLLILNLGVALWWATRAKDVPPPAVALPAGVEPLRLLGEPASAAATLPAPQSVPAVPAQARGPATADGRAGPDAGLEPGPEPGPEPESATAAQADPPRDTVALPDAAQCHAFGPFDGAQAATRAAAALRPAVLRVALREARSAPRGWDVRLAGLADRAAAEAMAARLVAAGFRDHYLMSADAGGRIDIALGRFGGEDAARRHRMALQAAGFEAVEAPIGDGGPVRQWVDVATGAQADLAVLQRAAGATRREPIDCAGFAAAGP
ncbi:SPOR domain-containing protein [Luteimonas kalidii]|uniref:SPOR domain-containing protein n=1 Tax=Luteimonas kalidii TaxID=3042025 RepID=A0ABT6JXE7_9GAMM|nr:SPOR domain-containing protein [Luteimonas kalidii]MDH5835375.1 SPOR domain-containing protein [Luteimonas kalidii]